MGANGVKHLNFVKGVIETCILQKFHNILFTMSVLYCYIKCILSLHFDYLKVTIIRGYQI